MLSPVNEKLIFLERLVFLCELDVELTDGFTTVSGEEDGTDLTYGARDSYK